jgi:hypothetical protein
MAFPVSPTDGQTATVNNIVYTYSSGNNTWTRSATGFVNLGASGNISATGNIYGNFIIGNVTATTAQTVTTNAQPNITSVGTLTSLTSSGLISTTGNIAGNYLFGNGSQLTNAVANTINTTFSGSANTFYVDFVAADGGNAQAIWNSPFLTYIPTSGILGASALTATGNINGANILSGGLLTATGNILGGNILTAGIMSSTGNAIHGNILTAGLISATANITASYFVGNGSLLTGISGGGGGGANIANGTSNVVVAASGNVTVGVAGTANVATFTSSGMSAPVVAATNGILVNSSNITANFTIAAGTNGFSVGPITIANNVSVTVSAGSVWAIV